MNCTASSGSHKIYSTPLKGRHLLHRMPAIDQWRVAFCGAKMRSLRIGKAEESKGEEKPWFVLSFCSAHEQSCKYEIGNRVRCAPYEMHSYITHALFRLYDYAKIAAKQSSGLFTQKLSFWTSSYRTFLKNSCKRGFCGWSKNVSGSFCSAITP